MTNDGVSNLIIDDIVDLAEQMSNPVLLKNRNGRYLYANQASIELFGMKKQSDLVGINAKELNNKVVHNWHNDYQQAVSDLDAFVVREHRAGHDRMRTIPCQDGTLRVQNMIKKPMINKLSSKVTSIFTFSENLTNSIALTDLLRLYVKFYPSKQTAIGYFLKYLGIDSLFSTPPSIREMETIIFVAILGCQKLVSKNMNISIRTVEENVRKIRKNKLKDEYFWTILLELMRNDRRKINLT